LIEVKLRITITREKGRERMGEKDDEGEIKECRGGKSSERS
jgi:hypothetical protein